MTWFRKLRRESAGFKKFFLQFKPNKTEADDVAKRNKQKAKASRSGKSPYAKHNKSPYQYSANYYAWRQSVTGRSSRFGG